jgi:outer membrane murein-binding lipoprotein Lpp
MVKLPAGRTTLAAPTLLAVARALLLGAEATLGACAVPGSSEWPAPANPKTTEAASVQPTIAALLQLRETMAESPPQEQAALLETSRANWQRSGSPQDGLTYAVVLGAPEHLDSNPVEASRVLGALLDRELPDAPTGDLRRFAEVLRGEYTARMALYAELARQKDMAARELRDSSLLNEARIEDLTAELGRLRRERDEARRKLQAITDMEQQLIEKEPEPTRPEGSR